MITGDEKIASSIDKIIDQLNDNLGESIDLIIRSFKIEFSNDASILVYMDGLVNNPAIKNKSYTGDSKKMTKGRGC